MPGDITFNSGNSWWGQNLTDFVNNGTISSARVDDMATRILGAWYLLGQDSKYPDGVYNLCSADRTSSYPYSQLQRLLPSRCRHDTRVFECLWSSALYGRSNELRLT